MALVLRSIFGVAAARGDRQGDGHRRGLLDGGATFADPMDTVVYGAAVGLGFAAYENLAYLVQHAEMWRSLAALRSVLTVPFHGALGIIAGAYLAIARAGTALGAHRHHRDWARISSWSWCCSRPDRAACGVRFPAADAAADAGSRSDHADDAGTASVLIGFSSIGFAVRLVRRVGRHHAPRTDSRARAAEPAAADVGAAASPAAAPAFSGLPSC